MLRKRRPIQKVPAFPAAGLNGAESEVNHSSATRSGTENVWNYTSTQPVPFLHGVQWSKGITLLLRLWVKLVSYIIKVVKRSCGFIFDVIMSPSMCYLLPSTLFVLCVREYFGTARERCIVRFRTVNGTVLSAPRSRNSIFSFCKTIVLIIFNRTLQGLEELCPICDKFKA
jgi:hypothetical protein